LVFNAKEKVWCIKKKLKYLDNNINKDVVNSDSKIIRLIEKKMFFRDSLPHFSRRILLMKWSLLYYNNIPSVIYINITTESKDSYLIYS
jgi:hypothetical protein